MRLSASVLTLVLLAVPVAGRAQQATANLNTGNFPAGITVIVNADVAVDKWIETQTFDSKNKAQAQAFISAVRGAGVPAENIQLLPARATVYVSTPRPSVAVAADPALFGRIVQLAHTHGLTGDTAAELAPADPQTLYNEAVALAIQRGRTTASAIAAADHQHVGRLVNFVPSPVELAKQLAQSNLPGLMFTGFDPGKVSAAGIATFELMP